MKATHAALLASLIFVALGCGRESISPSVQDHRDEEAVQAVKTAQVGSPTSGPGSQPTQCPPSSVEDDKWKTFIFNFNASNPTVVRNYAAMENHKQVGIRCYENSTDTANRDSQFRDELRAFENVVSHLKISKYKVKDNLYSFVFTIENENSGLIISSGASRTYEVIYARQADRTLRIIPVANDQASAELLFDGAPFVFDMASLEQSIEPKFNGTISCHTGIEGSKAELALISPELEELVRLRLQLELNTFLNGQKVANIID